MKKVASSAYKSVAQKAFLEPELLYVNFPFCYTGYLKDGCSGMLLTEVIFNASSRIVLSETGLVFLNRECLVLKNIMTSAVGATALICFIRH